MKRSVVLGTEIDAVSFDEAIDLALEEMTRRRGAYVVTPNTEMLLRARKDDALREALHNAALALPDGVGVQLAAHILGIPLGERIAGVDFAHCLLARMSREGKSVFLLGAEEGVAQLASDQLLNEFPSLEIKGLHSGYFDEVEEKNIRIQINTAAPDLLIVCLGSPRQEIWMNRNSTSLNVGIMAGLGGTLDIFARRLPRAPRWMRSAGLEWLFRLVKEPRRIVRMIRLPHIITMALQERIGGRKRYGQG